MKCFIYGTADLKSFISTIYSPLADTIKRYILEYHVYADDAQLRLAIKTGCPDKMIECKTTSEQCVRDIDDWMVIKKLKRNQGKTEVVLISSRYRPKPSLEPLQFGKMIVLPSSSVRNPGVIFDKYSHYHIRNIAFVTAKLDSCNSLLYRLPQHLISRLQSIQNTEARVVTRTRKFDHITSVLKQRHWLPVRYRIVFKTLPLV